MTDFCLVNYKNKWWTYYPNYVTKTFSISLKLCLQSYVCLNFAIISNIGKLKLSQLYDILVFKS